MGLRPATAQPERRLMLPSLIAGWWGGVPELRPPMCRLSDDCANHAWDERPGAPPRPLPRRTRG